MDLTETSKDLKEQAEILLKKFDLKNFLSKYGDAYVVGSVALDLMTWRDIDIEVICNNTPTKSDAIEISRHIFDSEGFRKISVIDYRDVEKDYKPKGLYIGTEYIDETKMSWKFDIWLLTLDSSNSKSKTENYNKKLTSENRQAILEIKSQIHSNPKYRTEVFSVDIYDSVIDKNIKNFDEFKRHMSEKGIQI